MRLHHWMYCKPQNRRCRHVPPTWCEGMPREASLWLALLRVVRCEGCTCKVHLREFRTTTSDVYENMPSNAGVSHAVQHPIQTNPLCGWHYPTVDSTPLFLLVFALVRDRLRSLHVQIEIPMSDPLHLAKCPNCGVYGITRESFEKFLTPECKEQLAAKAYAPIAVLHFKNCCPRCQPQFQTEVRVSLLRPKRDALRRILDRILHAFETMACAIGILKK